MPIRRIATMVGRSVVTVFRPLARRGLSGLKALEPALPVVRYERELPGELLHIDTEKLGCIECPSHRATGDRRSLACELRADACQRAQGPGLAVSAAAVAHFEALGVKVKRLIMDNGSAYRSRLFAKTCQALVHQTLPTADQWEGREIHPDVPARVGLWACPGQQRRARRMAAGVPELLHRPKAALGSGLQAASFPPLREQPGATQHADRFANA